MAAIAGVLAASAWVYETLNDPDPRGQRLWVIVFRLGFSALVLSLFIRRALGRKIDPIGWAPLAMLVAPGIWDAKTFLGSVLSAISVAAILLGARSELLRELAARREGSS